MPDTCEDRWLARLEQDTRALVELLGIEDFMICKSPYAGIEVWWNLAAPKGKRKMLTYVSDFAYSNTNDLPGDWTWQGDYYFLYLA